MDKDDLTERRFELRARVHTLEWDKQHNQLNFAHDKLLDELKKEIQRIDSEINSIQ